MKNVDEWSRPVQLAYLAASIDGEGSIMMLLRYKEGLSRQKRFRPKLQISQTDKSWLEVLQKIAGTGYITHTKKNGRMKNGGEFKDEYMLMIDSPYRILKELMPFLILKSKQSELLIEHIEVARKKKPQKGKKQIKWTEEEIIRSSEIREEIKLLNKTGK